MVTKTMLSKHTIAAACLSGSALLCFNQAVAQNSPPDDVCAYEFDPVEQTEITFSALTRDNVSLNFTADVALDISDAANQMNRLQCGTTSGHAYELITLSLQGAVTAYTYFDFAAHAPQIFETTQQDITNYLNEISDNHYRLNDINFTSVIAPGLSPAQSMDMIETGFETVPLTTIFAGISGQGSIAEYTLRIDFQPRAGGLHTFGPDLNAMHNHLAEIAAEHVNAAIQRRPDDCLMQDTEYYETAALAALNEETSLTAKQYYIWDVNIQNLNKTGAVQPPSSPADNVICINRARP